MAVVRISWWMMLFGPEDGDKMRALFKDFFALLPLSQTELAKALRVEQPTVSRWAAGKSTPDLEQMQAVVAVVESRIADIQERVQLTKQVLDAAEDVAAGPGRGSGIGFKRWKAAREKFTKLLQQRSRRRRQARTRRGRSPKAGGR